MADANISAGDRESISAQLQPIETAPKDGQEWILLLVGHMVVPGYWRDTSEVTDEKPGWCAAPYPYFREMMLRTPDGWMPLPAPRPLSRNEGGENE